MSTTDPPKTVFKTKFNVETYEAEFQKVAEVLETPLGELMNIDNFHEPLKV
jgi:hypothetical protein